MKKRMLALSLAIVLIATIPACQSSGTTPASTANPVPSTTSAESTTSADVMPTTSETILESENIPIMPFSDRRFIWTNGLAIETKQVTTQNNGVNIEKYYPVLSGLKNTEVENLLNQEITSVMDLLMRELETSITENAAGKSVGWNSKISNVSVVYNCNNVIFIEYYAYIDAKSDSGFFNEQKIRSFGYDLNTGNKLELQDLFKRDSNYKKLINDFVTLYIIEHNYDDPNSSYMSKSFQGIRDDQDFSFDLTGLRVILDEKNDEFINLGYPNMITVPLKIIGDDLAVFDRYFDEKNNLFEKTAIKALLPNPVEYKVDHLIQESGQNYGVNIETGKFINMENKELATQLETEASPIQDVAGFVARAKAYGKKNPGEYYGNMGHTVGLTMNAGGFLSVFIYEVAYEKGAVQDDSRFFNYDFNQGKPMKLADLFTENFDYRTAIGKILNDPAIYSRPDGTAIDEEDLRTMSEEEFYFDQYGVNVFIPQPGRVKTESMSWIPFENIGWANITLSQ